MNKQQPFVLNEWGSLYHGDALDVLSNLEDNSIDLLSAK